VSGNPTRPGARTVPAAPAGNTGPADGADPAGRRWRDAVPELVIAGVAVLAAALAGAAVSGWPGVVVVASAATVLALVVLRAAIPRSAAQAARRARVKPQARSISGYGQRRYIVATSLSSRGLYEADLRPDLEHILAARLADHHGVNLYTEPAAARKTFCRTRADEALWPWIDPAQALGAEAGHREPRAISGRTLAHLITRLEQL
jgi:hypothetical protein